MDSSGVSFSVLMVTYNSATYLREAIESVLKLDYDNYELVICDDNSKDESWEIINSYNDPHIVKHRNTTNLGEYNNRNNAINRAKGDYIIFIDGDDMIHPHALQYLSAIVVKYPQCAMLLGHGVDPKTFEPVVISPENFYRYEYLDKGVFAKSFVNLLLKRSAVIEVGTFDDTRIKMGDKYIQYKVGLKYKSLVIGAGFAHWRLRPGQASEFVTNAFKYTADNNRIVIPLLDAPVNITEAEREQARVSLYRQYIGFLLRQLAHLRFTKVLDLYRAQPIPARYFKLLFSRRTPDYFSVHPELDPLKGALA